MVFVPAFCRWEVLKDASSMPGRADSVSSQVARSRWLRALPSIATVPMLPGDVVAEPAGAPVAAPAAAPLADPEADPVAPPVVPVAPVVPVGPVVPAAWPTVSLRL